jgi:NAD(P)-dependent dehydrogenase (short-subunit alcohol dehydrogenase family)
VRYVVIGGTSGIGLATVAAARALGHEVVAVGRDVGKFGAAAETGAATAQLDATDPEAVRVFFRQQGTFDHLVLCASGGAGAGNFRDLNLAELRSGFEGKFWPQVHCAQASLDALSDRGSITFIGSISSRALQPGTAGLAAINSAIEALVPVLASELRPVRVNAVVPGVVDTPWWSRLAPEAKAKLFDDLANKVPVGRIGQPEDLASAILFVTTNTFVTGSIIDCDGGWKLRGG